MNVTLELPAELARYTDDQTSTPLSGATIGAALEQLWQTFPKLRTRVLNQRGQLHSHLLLTHNQRRVSNADFSQTPLADGDKLAIESLAVGG